MNYKLITNIEVDGIDKKTIQTLAMLLYQAVNMMA